MSSDGPFAALSRRRLLRLALGAGGVIASGVGGVLALRGTAQSVEGLRCLSNHEYRTFSALAVAAFPEGEVFPKGAGTLDLARAFDAYLADEPEWAQSEAKAALALLELGCLAGGPRFATFSHLTPGERLAVLDAWSASSSEVRRQVALGFKKFLALVYYDQPSVWPELAYEGPLIRAEP